MESSPDRSAVELSPNAITVLEKRYLLKDETGKPVEQLGRPLLARGDDDRGSGCDAMARRRAR